MFLFMAIFEKFLRPNSPESTPAADGRHRNRQDVESQLSFNGKLRVQSPKLGLEQFIALLRDGQVVAVKQLKSTSSKGDTELKLTSSKGDTDF
ncbi:hypothetical protein RHSIM_Rhsim02G0121200 [Rhododendron simsii]|uniref:Uncharacterized protein n=1 Tax=Rhododendron simsii TaxID=118357 RepID=A0A834LTB5_RHOSS|nr:hypothetical protein RHSIM_Rhsim02G0121200 [Rhododendron simsii]